MKKLLSFVKNQRGLTLVELLAVVVILGIIAAIAVPSIGAIIDNNKKDAHIANAEQMVNAVRMSQASNLEDDDNEDEYNLDFLIEQGFIENINSPGNEGEYDTTESKVVVSTDEGATTSTYTITLKDSDGHSYIDGNTIEQLRGNDDDDGESGRELVELDSE